MESEEFIIGDNDESLIEIDSPTQKDDANFQKEGVSSKGGNSDASKLKPKNVPSKVINYMFQQQKGQSSGPLNLSSIEKEQLTPKRYYLTTHNELHINECEFIRTGLDGQSVVGLWQGSQYDGIVYRLQLKLNSSCSTKDGDDTGKTIASMERQGPYFIQTSIADLGDTYFGSQNCVLYVGSKFTDNPGLSSSVVCTFASTSPTNGKQHMMASRQLTCCSGCRYDNLFGIGTTEGIIVYKDENACYTDEYNDKVNAMELSRYGNVVYCGCDSAYLIVHDLRSEVPVCYRPPMDGVSAAGISDLKLLSNENKLVVSSVDGTFGKIDMRYNGIVTIYPGHVAHRRKLPFTVSESADLVCAAGSDNMTRIWSYSTGELLHSIKPPMPYAKTHSTLVASGLRWAVAIFQKNRMYVVEPWA